MVFFCDVGGEGVAEGADSVGGEFVNDGVGRKRLMSEVPLQGEYPGVNMSVVTVGCVRSLLSHLLA